MLQVRSLLSLFVDIEHTDRSNAFYEKFSTRHKIGEILGQPRSPHAACSSPAALKFTVRCDTAEIFRKACESQRLVRQANDALLVDSESAETLQS